MHGFLQSFQCNVHLESATEKKHQPTRAFCDGINNFRKPVACAKKKSSGRPSVSTEAVGTVRESFVRSPRKSTRVAAHAWMPQTTVWKVLRKKLNFKPYHLQLTQEVTKDDKMRRFEFCVRMQQELEHEDFANKLIFSDEATFHLSGHVNRHNVRVWGM